MATIEKIKKKKKEKLAARSVKDEAERDKESKTGSVISVREAQEDAKADSVQVGSVFNFGFYF